MNLKIVNFEKIIYDGEVEKVNVPSVNGPFQVFKNHGKLISILDRGKIQAYSNKKETFELEIEKGVIKIQKNDLLITVLDF